MAHLRRSPSLSFIPLFPSNLRPFGAPPSIGRGCRAQRGGVGFLLGRRSRLLFAFPLGKGVVSRKAVSSYRSLPHWGRGTASAVDRVLSQTAYLRRSPSLSFIPLFPSNLRPFGAPPSIGRRKCPREPLPLEGAAERSEAGLASFLGGEAASSLTFPLGKALCREKRYPPIATFPTRGRLCRGYCFSTHASIM